MIETERLVLRPYVATDWDAFSGLVQDGERMQALSGALGEDAARRLFDRLLAHDAASGLLGWAVLARGSERYCGHVFLNDIAERSAEIGFVLCKELEGQGLATELGRAVLDYAVHALGCTDVRASVDEDNTRSKAVLARIGMGEVAREVDAQGTYLVYQKR